MAKSQKNVNLSDEVISWLEEREVKTGAKPSRIVLAALACYASMSETERGWWMRLSGEVEAGRMSFVELPRQVAEHEVLMCRSMVEATRSRADLSELHAEALGHLSQAEASLDLLLKTDLANARKSDAERPPAREPRVRGKHKAG